MKTNIEQHIAQILQNFKQDCLNPGEKDKVAHLRKKYLKEQLQGLYQLLKNEPDEMRRNIGQQINALKIQIEEQLNQLTTAPVGAEKSSLHYDPTVGKKQIRLGQKHPLTEFYQQLEQVFVGMGFAIAQGPEIEDEQHNFTKLNIPLHHPARDMQDTFYLANDDILLRSHTSSVQVRIMEKCKPPIKIISPGTVYRVDDIDPQHTPMFYQLEGLVVDKGIAFSDLKGVLITFINRVFGQSVKVNFRPSYYPYTEPSAAIDMSCLACQQRGCRTCKNSGWITVLGAGMVHPNVFAAVGIDPTAVSGFAFGMGINRLAMIYFGLNEIRAFYENNIQMYQSA